MSVAAVMPTAPAWTHVWRWRALHPELHGKLCRILAWSEAGKRVQVEFQDGQRVFAPRPAIRAQRNNPLTLLRAKVGR